MEEGVEGGLYVYVKRAEYAPGTGDSATLPRAAREPASLRILLIGFLSYGIAPLSPPFDFDFDFVFDFVFGVGLCHPDLIIVRIIVLSLRFLQQLRVKVRTTTISTY